MRRDHIVQDIFFLFFNLSQTGHGCCMEFLERVAVDITKSTGHMRANKITTMQMKSLTSAAMPITNKVEINAIEKDRPKPQGQKEQRTRGPI